MLVASSAKFLHQFPCVSSPHYPSRGCRGMGFARPFGEHFRSLLGHFGQLAPSSTDMARVV